MAKRLKIGIAGPFSGPRSAYGALILDAVTSEKPWFEPVWGDDMAEVQQAEVVARRFVTEGVDAIVGHFNSDCARVAGEIYLKSGLPFLMPASTANDLIEKTAGIRICGDDSMQIDALQRWLAMRGTLIGEIWEDGSPYAARLSKAIRERGLYKLSSNPKAPISLLGNHHAVAQEIRTRSKFPAPVFVPDDCTISKFIELLDGVKITVVRPIAKPDFASCVRISLAFLHEAAEQPQSLAVALDKNPFLAGRQYIAAGFTIHITEVGQTNILGIAS